MSTARLKFAQRKALPACVLGALTLIAPGVEAATRTVLNCADAGTGSLRTAVAAAANGDTVVFDTTTMACSTISLTTGAITTSLDDLVLSGPGAGALTIDAGPSSPAAICTSATAESRNPARPARAEWEARSAAAPTPPATP